MITLVREKPGRNGTAGGTAKRLRRGAAVAVSAGVVLTLSPMAAPAQAADAPSVTAKGVFLHDNSAGVKLYGKDTEGKRPIASTTKIMTARVVLGDPDLDLDRRVTVQQAYRDYVAQKGASTADLRTGDKLTVRQLLYAMMLPSGCDAAYALADTFGDGSTRAARVASFIGKMNSTADALGMTNTKFDSFDGVSATGENYSTPRDLVKVTRSAMKYGTFANAAAKQSLVKSVPTSNGGTRTYTWYNTNQLLGSYSGAHGVKTGTTTPSGPCLVFTATRDGRNIIGVILNDANRYTDAAKLLDYAFGSNTASTMKLRKLPEGAQRD